MSKKTIALIKRNMKEIGATYALGYMNEKNELLAVVYDPDENETILKFKEIIPRLGWASFSIKL